VGPFEGAQPCEAFDAELAVAHQQQEQLKLTIGGNINLVCHVDVINAKNEVEFEIKGKLRRRVRNTRLRRRMSQSIVQFVGSVAIRIENEKIEVEIDCAAS
jgi:hypothetical protein